MSFDSLSRYYDQLAGIVFLGAIKRSQEFNLRRVPDDANILIIGGGTGWILETLPSNITRVTYIESSSGMMRLSRKRKTAFPVDFILSPFEEVELLQKFDVVITNYYLDQFKEQYVTEMIAKVCEVLKPEGYWLVTDFVDQGKWWQKPFLGLMYYFFRKTTSIANKRLIAWQNLIANNGFIPRGEKHFFGGFIASVIYNKRSISD